MDKKIVVTLPNQYVLIRWLFLRLLGVIYLIAFVSFWVQIEGLVGSNGILPAADFLVAVSERTGAERYHLVPTIFWLNATDPALHWVCGSGALLSLLLIFGVFSGPVLMLLWFLYLSLVSIGREFLAFQWDNLLLEAGFLAIFFASWGVWPKPNYRSPPPRAILWLLRWLLFRLMFSSGLVKLLSGDPTWRSLTALNFHYETQPLPVWTSWYVHQLPEWFHKISVVLMFGIELVVPFLIFAPRRLRLAGCTALVFLQVLILVTGNYAFFNWLSIILCLLLLDDAHLRRLVPPRLLAWFATGDSGQPSLTLKHFQPIVIALVTAVIVLVSGMQMIRMFFPLPGVGRQMLAWVAPFRTVNSYGLFAVMTTTRPEIIIEGSQDGETWQAYEFKWKPGDVQRRPRFVAPHQPRLDWQMWFAALGTYRTNRWLINFLARLLEGSPEVLALLAHNPFPEEPPRFVRAVVYDYRFTSFDTTGAEGKWWQREVRGLYAPILSLPDQQ